ncbi:MAG: glycosyltransferase family 39 protein [Phormidesmis sp.]
MAFDIVLLAFIGLGVGLRCLWVGKRELWYDEVLSVLLSSGQKNAYRLPDNVPFALSDLKPLLAIPPESGVAGTIETVKNVVKGSLGDVHPPLFYLSEHGWMRLFGNGEAALRGLVLLTSLAALTMAYFLGRRVLGQRGGLIFTALLAMNPFFLAHSLNLRMYMGMVFWVLVSGWGWLALLESRATLRADRSATLSRSAAGLLRCLVVLSITAGLMTQYLFAYWLFALAALALYLDRKCWFQHGLTLGAGVLLFSPWALWGVRQQARNRGDVLSQISVEGGPLQSALRHGKDLAQTVGDHLLLGQLTAGMLPVVDDIKPTAVAVGCGVLGFLVVCVVGLYRRRQYRILMIGGLMGLFPLAVALGIDVVMGTYTLGFGWGRSTIAVLPGCVLLVAAWLDRGTGRWREGLTVGLLAIYLAVNVGDFGLRDRQIFHQVARSLPETDEPTLVAMNTQAWGHVLRSIYYLDGEAVDVLATKPAELPAALENALTAKAYSTVLWLNSDYPLWEAPKTDAEAAALNAQTEAVLSSRLMAAGPAQNLEGTMKLDHFALQVYQAGDDA